MKFITFRCNILFISSIILYQSKVWTQLKNYGSGSSIHLSDFPEKHPKNADLFFSRENGGGLEYFFKFFFDPS